MRFTFLALLLTGCASTSWHVERATDIPSERPLRAGFLIVDGVYNTELTAPMDLFQHTIFHTKPGIEVFTVAPTKAPIRTFEGLVITPDYDFASAPAIDILVVPSAEHSMDTDLENTELIAWVKETGDEARYVMSLCDGAFVLAKAGLVDGRWSTTFPSDQDRYAETFPTLEVKRGVSFVHDGKLLTSEGGAKSFDVAMYLIDHLYGVEVAKGVGRGLIIAWPPVNLPFLVR
ncbi:MAG: DJ-1/PfpI family protein [Deltaproteobacteria bacterium]